MSNLAEKFLHLKTQVGGNREQTAFEYSFGTPESEVNHITPPSRANRRILAEVEYAISVSSANGGAFQSEIEQALDGLLAALERDGVLTDEECLRAEKTLMPMAEIAKSYKLILSGHSHIDMNWMWGYHETVAATLATFSTMCNIMDEYPLFTYTQSQGSVYRIVEEYDPELMERIKARIAEGRWQVAATSWVEPDKNMPSGESLLRHIEYTRSYLSAVWGVKDFDIDFVPDTFGHAETIPEIDAFGGVKYMYHCRGNARKDLLYLYRAPSGREVMVLKEANWYNAGITPHMANGLMDVVKRSSGLKCGMVLFGVGDHGGGPTRRDVERALDMMTWPIYPTIQFGGLRDYFREAEAVRGKLPVVTDELNFFSPGCYTTQSRIKLGNRHAEAALYDTEALAALAGRLTPYRLPAAQAERVWRDVLFTHFHDILTGSCVRDSREYAMGLFQTTAAFTNTQREKAMRAISGRIDTSALPAIKNAEPRERAEHVKYDTQSEGAGVGYGVGNFAGVPVPERGSGLMRLFNVFNSLPYKRSAVVEITVWDYTGDLKRVYIEDLNGRELPFRLVDSKVQWYWDHRYFRILVRADLPPLGYTTVILRQRKLESYPVYLMEGGETSAFYDDITLDNGVVRAVIDASSGRVKEFTDLKKGVSLLQSGKTAGLEYLETECRTSNAWNIGRTLRKHDIDKCVELTRLSGGPVRQSAKAKYVYEGTHKMPSSFEVTYSLDEGTNYLRMDIKADWQEQGAGIIPVLAWSAPASDMKGEFRYLIPSGSTVRRALNNDVPGIGGAAALMADGAALSLLSDCKYGYRGTEKDFSLTLINSAVNPDPYPERGEHVISLFMAAGGGEARELQRLTDEVNHAPMYCSASVHEGDLPWENSLLELVGGGAAVTSVRPAEKGIFVRGYETDGKDGEAVLRVKAKAARMCDLSGRAPEQCAAIVGDTLTLPVKAHGIWEVYIEL